MKLYNLYLARKIISYFLVVLLTLILLIWFTKAISFISFITEKGINVVDFLNLFILILPWLLLIIIPVSLFIAVVIGYNQMLSHNEIIILKNAGLDNLKLARPAIALALICCIMCYFISFFLMPFANKKLRTARTNFNHNYVNLVISPGIFESLNRLTIYVRNRDENNKLSGILIYDGRNPEYTSTVTAKNGIINQGEQSDGSILLYLTEGTIEKSDRKTHKTDIINFDSYVVNLSDNNRPAGDLTWKASERYIGELLHPDAKASDRELNNYYVELHQRITYPLLSLILVLIAAATILSSKFNRSGNLLHSLKASLFAAAFVGLFIFSYRLIEYSRTLTPLVYLNLLIFVMLSFHYLKPKK
jgi:lipopolysaccharide export system permease protein